jgi:hypothetical protein
LEKGASDFAIKKTTSNKLSDQWSDLMFFALSACLFILPPLFFLELKNNQWVEGFIPIRMVNAELKSCVIIITASLLVGIVWIRAHLARQFHSIDKRVYFWVGIFLISICISTLLAHNIERAFVYSFIWHLLPMLFAFSLFQIDWTIDKLNGFMMTLLLGGLISCLVVMDQHYQWTDWSHQLPRTGYGGLIYNRNFAAEYHAPLLPLALCLAFVTKSRIHKGIFLGSLVFIFIPALSLSLARGAWVGLIAGCFLTGLIFISMIFLRQKDLKKENKKQLFGYHLLLFFYPLLCLFFYLPQIYGKRMYRQLRILKYKNSHQLKLKN